MAENPFAGLSLKDLGDGGQEENGKDEKGLDLSGLSLSDLDAPGVREGEERKGYQSIYTPREYIGMEALDSTEEDALEFIVRRGKDIFGAAVSRGLGAIDAEIGRTLTEGVTDLKEGTEALADDGGDYLDRLMIALGAMNPKSFVAAMSPELLEGAPEQIERGQGVFREASEDLKEIAGEADTIPKQIAFDVTANLSSTLPALATAPFRSPALTATALGGLSYFDTVAEATEAGSEIEEARGAGFVDAFVEVGTEMIPLGTLFKLGEGKSLFKNALKFLTQEVGTEMTATALQDLNAKLSYEPDMTWEQAMENLARTAMSTPFSAGLQVAGIRGMEKLNQVVEDRKAPKYTPFDREVVESSEKLREAQEEAAGLRGELDSIWQEIQAEAANTPTIEEVEANADIYEFTEGQSIPDPGYEGSLIREAAQERRIFPTRDGKRVGWDEIQPGEVLRAETTGREEVARAERFLRAAKEQGLSRADVNKIRAQLEKTKRAVRREESILNRTQDLYRQWVKKYAPGMKIVLSTDPNEGDTFGFTMPTNDDSPMVISINTRSLLRHNREIGDNRRQVAQATGDQQYVGQEWNIPETVVHEFGHALIAQELRKQPDEVRQALWNDWQRFLSAYRETPLNQMAGLVQGQTAEGWRLAGDATPFKREFNQGIRGYIPSFPEFIAHRMARTQGATPEVREFFKGAETTLRKYWKGLPRVGKYDKSFDLFMQKLGTEVKLRNARARVAQRARVYRDAVAAMRKAHTTPPTTAFGWGTGGVVPPRRNGGIRTPQDRSRRINSAVDTFNRFIQYTAGLTHISDMNKHIPGVENYRQAAFDLWRDKMRWTERAAEVLRDWANGQYLKGKKQREQFAEFMFAADARSDELGRGLREEELRELAREYELTDGGLELAQKVWGTFREALGEVEAAVITDLQNQLSGGNAQEINAAIQSARRDFARLRNRNYMPHTRFGSYTVTGYAQEAMTYEGTEYSRGATIFFGTYATEKAAIQAKKELEREARQANFGIGLLDDNVRELLDLPPALAQLLERKLDLNSEQQKSLTEIRAILAPGQSFRKRMIERENVPGYSKDALRVYADYMQKFAGHLARIKHIPTLKQNVDLMKESARGIRQQGGNTVKREEIIQWFERHMDYLMNPGNELTSLRAMGFLWYLGFNVKSAVVNSTQIPMLTYPYLAQEFNDVSAIAAITNATRLVTQAQFTEKGISPELTELINELTKRGTIDESLATELAALSEGGFLSRTPGQWVSRAGLDSPENTLRVQKFFEYGALMFQTMEKVNRRITAVAAYNLARKSGASVEAATDFAQEAIIQTQYEYARINRPEMMRGPVKSNVFMFWQYLTNTMYALGMNKGVMARYAIIMFLLGGIEGLPGMGNVLDLLDYAIKKFKEASGWKDPKSGARAFLRDAFEELEDDPMMPDIIDSHLLMNGASSRLFGTLDLSGSISMGRLIPGTEYLATDMNPQTELLGTMQNLSGAVVNIPVSVLQAVYGNEPDTWKRVEKALPSSAQGLSQAVRYATRGKETDSTGATLAEFNWPDDPHTWSELMGRASGFQISRIAEERERRFMTYDAINYWTTRQRGLTGMLNYAVSMDDQGMIEESLDRIRKFNGQVPFPEMAIQPRNLMQSIRQGQKSRILRGEGIEERKKFYRLSERERERYSEED